MSQSLDLQEISKGLSVFLRRYNTVIFIVFTAICISTALIIVVLINNSAVETNSSNAQVIDPSFDEATIKRLQKLNSDNGSKLTFPSGRTNPFVE